MVSLMDYRNDPRPGYTVMTLAGLSTDAKPLGTYNGSSIANGSVFICVDTGDGAMFDEEHQEWHDL